MLKPSPEIKKNIAEYILYLWQVEDLIRACGFKLSVIEERVLFQFRDAETIEETKEWYRSLIREMHSDELESAGHVMEVREVLNELFYLHTMLLNVNKDEEYKAAMDKAMPYIQELNDKAGGKTANPIEVCFNGMYGKLMLKLKNQEISKETELAFEAFRKVLSYLSVQYNGMKSGEVNYLMN